MQYIRHTKFRSFVCSLNETTARLAARTYAQAVAGDITEMSFNNFTR
jgi:hypothetical protein